jgi:hypothetical protein
LILTARHILTCSKDDAQLEVGTEYDIRCVGEGDNWRYSGASLYWESLNLDVALLKICGDVPDFLNKSSAVKFGFLGTDDKFTAEGVGFPAAQRTNKEQNNAFIEGQIDQKC